jgi:hypothetical protein
MSTTQLTGYGFGQGYTRTYNDDVDILAMPSKQQVAYPTADDVALQIHLISLSTDETKSRILYFRVNQFHREA